MVIVQYYMGEHALVTRVLKGASNQHPPQPCYNLTWNVAQVTEYLQGMGNNSKLPLQGKLAMLFCLTRPSRSSELCGLDLKSRRYIPEGKLSKLPAWLSSQGLQNQQPNTQFLFLAFHSSSAELFLTNSSHRTC